MELKGKLVTLMSDLEFREWVRNQQREARLNAARNNNKLCIGVYDNGVHCDNQREEDCGFYCAKCYRRINHDPWEVARDVERQRERNRERKQEIIK